ncbi:SRPBCC family protein [Arthrobacter pascens]|uniref:SRPBCC family protein n=1 Tax=Arthrobacter pascens TaxID=1677 RepID=UPI0027D79058|nr:SRPBCC family protein [Arthrobacter pascens]
MNKQDFDACERCQPAMGSKIYAKGGVLVPSEHHIGAFHDWVKEKWATSSLLPNAGPTAADKRGPAAGLIGVCSPSSR